MTDGKSEKCNKISPFVFLRPAVMPSDRRTASPGIALGHESRRMPAPAVYCLTWRRSSTVPTHRVAAALSSAVRRAHRVPCGREVAPRIDPWRVGRRGSGDGGGGGACSSWSVGRAKEARRGAMNLQ